MAIQISPGVAVTEVDLTTIVPSVLSTTGAIAGTFQWGPAGKITMVDTEDRLVARFGRPSNDANTYETFFTAASFLAYGNQLQVVRAANTTSNNASSNTTTGVATLFVPNSDVYQATYLNTTTLVNTNFIARYQGEAGNGLAVSVCANTTAFATWTYKSLFSSAPGTSAAAAEVNGANDEMHIVVIDTKGGFFNAGEAANTVVETYAFVSKAIDSIDSSGNSNYYKNKIYNNSEYIYAMDPVDAANTANTWGSSAANTSFFTANVISTFTLAGATSGAASTGEITTALDLFNNKQTSAISLLMTGSMSSTNQQNAIDLAVTRADCIAFVSPPQSAVVNKPGTEASLITTWNTSLARSTSYAFADSGWKYMFDKYNNTYRWIPLNGDMAGLCAYTDGVRDPWYSPAGFNRGNLKNVVKLAWNPSQANRNTLYSLGINPVVSFPGQGIVLFGDKTLQAKPSAFDRINVRRLFIVLETSIAKAAQYSLFEFNDAFTQAQFVSLVTPFLRQVQGRRGITDFKVVCDDTNNTPQVVDANQFVGSIFIKPARSINFIQLNFVAVGTGVSFSTVVGAV